MGKLSKRVIKRKKLQFNGRSLLIVIPSDWIKDLDWNRNTQLILEFLPYRRMIILSEHTQHHEIQPINEEGQRQRDELREKLNEEVSDIVTI